MCRYSQCDYYYTFKACAPKIRRLDPKIRIHANSWDGQVRDIYRLGLAFPCGVKCMRVSTQLGAAPIAQDPQTLPLVDAFTWHTVNAASVKTFGNQTRKWAYDKVDFTNEMEYQPGSPFAGTEVGTVAAVNTFLNTLTFKHSPTGVIILHAIKPTTNLESLGYGWTWWRSTGSPAPEEFPTLQPNHFEFNYWNWNSVAPVCRCFSFLLGFVDLLICVDGLPVHQDSAVELNSTKRTRGRSTSSSACRCFSNSGLTRSQGSTSCAYRSWEADYCCDQ
eukprot:SAG31_NODE_1079_length_10031_cov_5.270741_3_plen_276_part_00